MVYVRAGMRANAGYDARRLEYQKVYQSRYRQERARDLIEMRKKTDKKISVRGTTRDIGELISEIADGYFSGSPEKVCKTFGCKNIASFREALFGDTCLSCNKGH